MNAEIFALAFPTPWVFLSDGLEVDRHGRLTLARIPEWPDLADDDALPAGGLAVARGRAYFTDTARRTIIARECDGSTAPFGCLRAGKRLGELNDAVGLAVSPLQTLLVASRGNDRVEEFDLATGQLVWTWYGVTRPTDVAMDSAGNTYVAAEDGVFRLDRYDTRTKVVPLDALGDRPQSLAVGVLGSRSGLFVSAGTVTPSIHAVPLDEDDVPPTLPSVFASALGRPPALTGPILLRSHESRLYLGSPTSRDIRVVETAQPSFLGALPGTPRGFSAIALDDTGALWATNSVVAARSSGAEPVRRGDASIGPIPLRLDPGTPHWLRLRASGNLAVDRATARAVFSPDLGDPDLADRALDKIIPIPSDSTSVTVQLELTAPVARDDIAAPDYVQLVDLRIDEPGWIEQLPAIYRARGEPGAFLDPFLRLARTGHDDVVGALVDLADQLDPATAIDDLDGDRWLDWLATWVDVHLDERWSQETRRSIVQKAFDSHGRRGTAAALQALIAAELSIDHVTITEPGDMLAVWLLGDTTSALGLTTMTAAGPASGSIVDVTASADRSHLIGPADYGAPLYGEVAHRFDVRVHAAHVPCEDDRQRLRALIDREKPAHTIAHLCVVEPGISVGLQSRVGVDAVLGSPRDPRAVDGLDGFDRDRPGGRIAIGDVGPLVLE